MKSRLSFRRRLATFACSGAFLLQIGACTLPTAEDLDAGVARFTDGFLRGFGYGLISNYLLS
jgi:hypothetical protein